MRAKPAASRLRSRSCSASSSPRLRRTAIRSSCRASSQKVDYEAELVVVIGTGGRDIPKGTGPGARRGLHLRKRHLRRDWQSQKPGGQWLLGKTFDTFAPLGPELVTADELPNVGDLRISLRLNGRTMQDSRTSQLIFGVADLVSYISGVCTLSPGDLIFTGTPPGVGVARTPRVYLQPGDTVEVEIEGIGVLTNVVKS